MKALIVEDHWQYFELMIDSLRERFPYVEFTRVKTESEFIQSFDELARLNFAVVVMDVMVEWAALHGVPRLGENAESIPEQTEEAKANGYFRAGIRCVKRLLEDHRTARIPIIIHSNLDEETIVAGLVSLETGPSDQLRIVPKRDSDNALVNALETWLK